MAAGYALPGGIYLTVGYRAPAFVGGVFWQPGSGVGIGVLIPVMLVYSGYQYLVFRGTIDGDENGR